MSLHYDELEGVNMNQPNPTTGEQEDHPVYFPHRDMEPEPERIGPSPYPPDPTTTDCSAKATQSKGEWTLQSISETLINGGYQGLLDAHNAALAAAWRKGHADAQAPALERIDELREQLAAERENRIREDKEWERSKQRDLQQLAAAVDALKYAKKAIAAQDHARQGIALIKIDAALAKIGGKP